MRDKTTAPRLREMKREGRKIVCVTAYDAYFAKLADDSGVDLILVGDSVGNVLLGYRDTVSVTIEDMVHHTRAAARGVRRALLVADLPFGTYQASLAQAIETAASLMRNGAHAVKLEGDYPEIVAALVKAGIPVVGHLGMTPQSVNAFGGHKVQGRGESGQAIGDAAVRLDAAGVSAIVLELMPADLAKEISLRIACPTIGIGAGAGCDGQIQVLHDVLGFADRAYHHAKAYAQGQVMAVDALRNYASEVREGKFPAEENSF